MRMSFILPGGGRSGGVRSTVYSANGLLNKGHEVRLLVYKKKVTLRSLLKKVLRRIYHSHGLDQLVLFRHQVEWFKDIKDVSFQDGEIVIASGWWAAKELRKVSNSKIKKVHYMRGVLSDLKKMPEAWGENVPKIAIASYIENILWETCKQKLYIVIHNGIDVNKYYTSVPENERDGISTILGIGYHKDPDTTISVLQTLQHECPDIPQYIFGAHRRRKEIPSKNYCRLPTLEQAREFYSRSLVWILASRSEGFSNPILEAMACGCAVVATDCGGPRDIIVDGENGFLVEIRNVKQIVEKVKVLLDDSKLRQKFVYKSQETIKKFSWENSVNKLESVLLSL